MLLACALVIWLTPNIRSQEPPKPGPEHEHLKQLEGTWDATVKAGDQESKGTMTYKMMGDYWLTSHFEGDFGGQKFEGRGIETYDPAKKKYVSAWADSMAPFLLVMEGDYDKANKTMTATGEGQSPKGKVKYTAVTKMIDADTLEFTLSAPGEGGKEAPMITISYKRKK
jgi:hypothetical protein